MEVISEGLALLQLVVELQVVWHACRSNSLLACFQCWEVSLSHSWHSSWPGVAVSFRSLVANESHSCPVLSEPLGGSLKGQVDSTSFSVFDCPVGEVVC